MALLDKIGKSLTRASANAGTNASRALGSKAMMGTLVGGAVIKGLSDSVGQSAIDNAMEIAFDNPEADRAVLGTDLSPSLLLSQAGLGPISGIAKNINMAKYGLDTGPMPVIGGGAGGAGLGAVGGALMGRKMGGIKGAIGGGILGSIIGGTTGASIGAAPTIQYMNQNRQLIRESPFSNTSMMTADALNATGDIVFGMHNSRRGY
jgi:hypothetical protein